MARPTSKPARKSPSKPARKTASKPAPKSKASKTAKPLAKKKSAVRAPKNQRPTTRKGPAGHGKPNAAAAVKAADAKSHARAMSVSKAALSKKAEDVLLIDVRGLTSIADFFVVMSGSAGPQLRAIAEGVELELKKQGVMPLSVEGQAGGNWVLIDYGDVVAHVFEPEARTFYDLEALWADAPRERITD